MPTKKSGLAAASVNSEIYTFGGQSINGTFDNNERYDTKRDVWSSDLPMPTSRLGLEAVSFNNIVYAFGGKSDLGIVGANEIFHAT
jgi:N-acetylneuraminic acid mutarotase